MAKFTISLDAKLMDRIATHFAAGEGDEGEVSDDTLTAALDYACNRKDALAKHSKKVQRVRTAMRDGKPLPDVEFRRYVPAFAAAKLDAEGTPKEVATWTHAAKGLERTSPLEAPAPKKAAKKAPAAPAKKAAAPKVKKAPKVKAPEGGAAAAAPL